MAETTDAFVTKEQLEIALAKLENKLEARFNAIDARFNAIDAKFNAQRILLLGILLGVIAQIVSAWIMHLRVA
jgi:hypothetical protein